MKNRLLTSLARLASQAYQEAFIVGGAREEYVLPEDLVEDVASLIELAMRTEQRGRFTESQLATLTEMQRSIRSQAQHVFLAERDLRFLVREDTRWTMLRDQAADCLRVFEIDSRTLTPDSIEAGDFREH